MGDNEGFVPIDTRCRMLWLESDALLFRSGSLARYAGTACSTRTNSAHQPRTVPTETAGTRGYR